MIVRVQVRKHGFAPVSGPDSKDDWRTNVCMVDYLVVSWCDWAEQQTVRTEPQGFLRTGRITYAWTVPEWDGDR